MFRGNIVLVEMTLSLSVVPLKKLNFMVIVYYNRSL